MACLRPRSGISRATGVIPITLKCLFFVLCLNRYPRPSVAVASPSVLQPPPNVFSAAPLNRTLDADAAPEDFTIRRRPVSPDVALLDRAARREIIELRLNLFPDAWMDVAVEKIIARAPHDYTLIGSLDGEGAGPFILTVKGDIALGNFYDADAEHYQLGYTAEGFHEVRLIDDRFFLPDITLPVAHEAPARSADYAAPAPADDGGIIDVLVVYTPAAKAAQGGAPAMETLINLAVDETNQAYDNSLITPRLNLVHQEEISYTEVDFSTDLSRLRDTGDGFMDSVHTLRNTHGADMVALISATTGACGIGYLMTTLSSGFAASAFSVARYSCAAGNYTFGHELGHNMGCQHAVGDTGNAQGDGLFNYSNGWRFTADEDGLVYRTIMAYSPGTRIQYFSNPNVAYKGTATGSPLGEADEAHNTRSINLAADTVANWRASVTTSTTTSILPGGNVRNSPFLHAADLNSDGRTDLIYIDLKGYVHTTTNLRDWTVIGLNKFSMVTSGDFSNDGSENELAGLNLSGYALYTTDLSSWTKIGDNRFSDLTAGDFSSAGARKDLAGINLNGYILHTDDLSSWSKIGDNRFSSLIAADFSSSGREKDLAAVNLNQYALYTTDLSGWAKIGDNKFTKIVSGDFSGSGAREDLAGLNLNQYILYTSDFTNWTRIGTNKFTTFIVSDLDGDGREDDLAGLNLNQYVLYTTDRTSWTRIGTNQCVALVGGDFDADGRGDDLAAVNLAGHVLYTTDRSSWTKIEKP